MLVIVRVSIAQQDTFFVATNGNDANPGTEILPWKTLQRACSIASPGVTILLKAGIYNEKVTMNVSGNATEGFITFKNYENDIVKIDGTGKNGDQLLLIQNKNYIRIVGLEFQNNLNQSFGTGIWIQGAGRNIEIRNCTFHDMRASSSGDAMAISVYGTNGTSPLSNIIIDSNHIYNCEPGHSEALTLNGNVDTFQITNNRVHDVNNIGIDMIGGEGTSPNVLTDLARNGICKGNVVYNCRSNYGGGYAAGIYVDGGENILIERNTVYQCDTGLEIGCENQGRVAAKMIVRDNLIFNNDKRGIGFGGYNFPATGKVKNSFFLNNTCFNNDILNTDAGELVVEYAESCVVKNNIFFSTTQNKLMVTTFGNNKGNIFDYNLWNTPAGSNNASIDYNGTVYSSFTAYQNGTGHDGHSLFANPLFVSATLPAPDLHLLSSSSAINAGDVNFIPAIGETDFDGNARVHNSRVDCGAYEMNVNAPDAPRNLSAVLNNQQIILQWNPNTENNILRYRIFGGTSGNPTTQLDSTNDTLKIISGIESGFTYYFRITAINTDGFSSNYSNEVFIDIEGEKKYRTIAATTSLAVKGNKMKFSKTGNLLTAPNLSTAIEYEFSKLGKNGKTFAGIEQTDKTLAKQRAWILFKKASDFGKLFTEAHTQIGKVFPLDSVRSNDGSAGKKLSKLFKPQRAKYSNFAVEQCVLFRFNILVSGDTVTPAGFGNLILDTNFTLAGKQLEGKTLSAIATEVDTLMTLWESRGINEQSDYENLFDFTKNILERINQGFAHEFTSANYTIDTNGVRKAKKPYALFLKGVKTAESLGIVAENTKQKENIFIQNKLSPQFQLQNYPNPFNPQTAIGFSLLALSNVTLKVYDVLGQVVATLINNQTMQAGNHEIPFDGGGLTSGIYFYRLSIDGKFSESKKLVLMK